MQREVSREFFIKRKLLLQVREFCRVSFIEWLFLKGYLFGKIPYPKNLLLLLLVYKFVINPITAYLGIQSPLINISLSIFAMYGIYVRFVKTLYWEKEDSLLGDLKNWWEKLKLKINLVI